MPNHLDGYEQISADVWRRWLAPGEMTQILYQEAARASKERAVLLRDMQAGVQQGRANGLVADDSPDVSV